ncbi:MFS transporter [archaeon]|nr:MAG: MFS transporter [archaeon]
MITSQFCQSVSGGAAITLAALTFVYFLENFDRYLIAVSPVPYVDYTSYEYSVLAGPAFTVVYTVGGLLFALYFMDESATGLTIATNKTGIWKHTKLLVLSVCSVIFSFSFFATALCSQFFELVFIRIAMGLTQSVITPFSTSLIKDIFPPSSTGAAFGVFNAGTYFAFAFSLSVGTYVYNEYGWRAGYVWFGIVGMGVGALLPFLASLQTPSARAEEKEEYSALSVDDSVHNVMQDNDGDGAAVGDGARNPTSTRIPSLTSTPPSSETSTQRMKDTLYAVLRHWRACPALWLVCLATGVRLGGGYIWSAYTPLFFSPLLIPEDDSISCFYSYNATATALQDMCGEDYPYCKGGECNSINR